MAEAQDMEYDGERRRYFRINDHVGLGIKTIDAADEPGAFDSFETKSNRFGLVNELRAIRDRGLPEMRQLVHRFPTVAACIENLERQLDCIAHAVNLDEPALSRPNAQVNISAQGLAFQSDRQFEPGQLVDIRLVLYPEDSRIRALARVATIAESGPGSRIAVEFVELRDSDREAIIKHVHALQLKQLREQAREAPGSGD